MPRGVTLPAPGRSAGPGLIILAGVSALLGCASMSYRECRQANWSEIGREDGQNGRPLSRLDEHRSACTRYDFAPDEPAYLRSREQALQDYCTPRGGYLAGRRGDGYHDVCGGHGEAEFLDGFRTGRQVHAVLADVRELRHRAEQAELDSLSAALSADERARLRLYAADLERRHALRRRDLEWLDARHAPRYGAPPLTADDMRY